MVVDELIIKKPRIHHGGEQSYREGISIIERITGHNFNGSREDVLEWWDQYKKTLNN
jgi:hypothetical protein